MNRPELARLSAVAAFFLLVSSNVSSLAQSSRPGLGAIPYSGGGSNGVTFRTWAPNATAVGVKGQFNGWATTPMVKEGSGGYWSIDIAGAQSGQEYKYRINNNADRRDPRSRRVVNSAGNSVIYDRNAFDWGGQSFSTPWLNDLVIYEMHPGTFNAESWVPSSFDKDIERLDHLKELGISAVEVMPVNEFAADKSWGYNPADLFAIESAYGGPDAFKRFVKACHERGIAVLVDVVHNHYGPSDLGLWQFDGWSQNGLGGIYFYNESAKAYTWWGDTRPDFGRAEVRQFIRDQIFMFLEEYKVDGFRWDSVFNMIYYNGGANAISESRTMLQDINWEISQSFPGKIRLAEDHAFDANMNFDGVWDVAFHDHLKWQVTQASDSDRNVNWLAGKISEWPSHQRVIFSESHDTIGALNSKHRLPRDIDFGNPSSIWARKRALLAASVVMTAPGVPMIFQGQEMNDDWDFAAETALRWSLTNTHAGIVRAYGDMVKLRRNKFGGTQGLKGTGVNVHHQDNVNKVMAMVRWDAGGGSDDVVVVMNLAATVWNSGSYQIEFPSTGTWYVHYNSDSTKYGSDFGNVGPTQVTASGSPAKAVVNMGMYATLIFSKTPPPSSGIATLNPPSPGGCVPVQISYQQGSGPLSGKTNVVLAIGYNGFQFAQDKTMTNQSGTWVTTYNIPIGAGEINFVFHDGAGTYDNNFGKDWNITVANCADIPSEVVMTPTQPQGCVPVTLTYNENAGPLKDATNVVLYIGRNNWQDIQSIFMGETSPGVWTNRYQMPNDTWQLDFVFHNNDIPTNRVWDNNGGTDWHVLVADCIDPDVTGVFITNPVSSITVSNSITNMFIAGYSSSNIIGQLMWSNTLTGQKNWVPAGGFPWTVLSLTLGEGANIFRISGITDSINPNDGAWDSASNGPYIATMQWNDDDNGGNHWGGGWQLDGGPSAGHFLAHVESNQNVGAYAWGLWAYNGGIASAVRPFNDRLNVGDTVSAVFENNWIDGGGVVGVGFQNRFGQNLFEYLFVGGDTNYLVNDSVLARKTGIPWSEQPQSITFQLTSPNNYHFTVNGSNIITGTLAVSSETVVDRIRFFNANAGGGFERNVYVASMSVTGAPLASQSYETEVTITRSYGPNSDPDVDGYATWEEEVAGTNPFDGSSRLPDAVRPRGIGVMEVDVDSSVAGRWYDIFVSSNLLHGTWSKNGLSRPGTGGGITLIFTNNSPELYYRTGVSTAP